MSKHLSGIAVAVVTLLFTSSGRAVAEEREPHTFLKTHIGFTDRDIRDMEQGKVVTKALETPVKQEVALFGIVWINGDMDAFVAKQVDIENFEKGKGVLNTKKLSDPPRLEDFAELTFPAKDLDAIPECEPGDCEVKVDAANLKRLQEEIDWSRPDAHARANVLIRELSLEGMEEYLRGGDKTFAAYRDKERPIFLDKEFDGLLKNSKYLYQYVPEFHHYLDGFPNAELPGSQEFLYWAKNDMGLRPIVRINHVVVYPFGEGDERTVIVGSKQLYASHYFHTALELKILARDSAKPDTKGYYLMSLNRSRSDGLTGFFGGIIRSTAQSRALSGLAKFLEIGRQQLESE